MTAPRRCRYWRCRKSFIGKREGARFCSDACRTRDYAEHHPRVHLKRQPAHKAGKQRTVAMSTKKAGLNEQSIEMLIGSLKSIKGLCMDNEPQLLIMARVQEVISALYEFLDEFRRNDS